MTLKRLSISIYSLVLWNNSNLITDGGYEVQLKIVNFVNYYLKY